MEYRIEQGPVYKMTGVHLRTTSQDGCNFTEIPKLWESVMKDGRFKALLSKAEGSTLGVCGVCHSFDMKSGAFTYSIAIEEPKDTEGLPAGCSAFEIPASNWAKFTSRGPLHTTFQGVIKRIYSEWFPTSGKTHAETAEIEFYPSTGNPEAADYWCEYWVPLKD